MLVLTFYAAKPLQQDLYHLSQFIRRCTVDYLPLIFYSYL